MPPNLQTHALIHKAIAQSWHRRMRTHYHNKLNKVFSLKFPEVYLDWRIFEEDQRTKKPKHCDSNNKDKDNSLNVNNSDRSLQFI